MPSGEYARLDRAQRAHLRVARARRSRRRRGRRSVGDVAQRRDHQVTRAVRIQVHHRDRRVGAFEHQRLGVVHRPRRRRLQSTQPSSVTPRVASRDVVRAPVGPEPLELTARHTCSTTSAASRSTNVVDRHTPFGIARSPRLFTPTVPCSTSSSPTTRMYGTFSSLGAPDARAERARRAVDHLGAEAFGLQPVGDAERVRVVAVADRQHRRLHRREPRRERAGVVLDEHPKNRSIDPNSARWIMIGRCRSLSAPT